MNLYTRMWNLREAYRALFGSPPDLKAGRAALEELAEFCRADRSCVQFGKDGRVDTHATAVAEGRRETFLKIQQMLALTDAQILKLRTDDEDEND